MFDYASLLPELQCIVRAQCTASARCMLAMTCTLEHAESSYADRHHLHYALAVDGDLPLLKRALAAEQHWSHHLHQLQHAALRRGHSDMSEWLFSVPHSSREPPKTCAQCLALLFRPTTPRDVLLRWCRQYEFEHGENPGAVLATEAVLANDRALLQSLMDHYPFVLSDYDTSSYMENLPLPKRRKLLGALDTIRFMNETYKCECTTILWRHLIEAAIRAHWTPDALQTLGDATGDRAGLFLCLERLADGEWYLESRAVPAAFARPVHGAAIDWLCARVLRQFGAELPCPAFALLLSAGVHTLDADERAAFLTPERRCQWARIMPAGWMDSL